MLEWLWNSTFSGPADAAEEAPRTSLRLNHIEAITEEYLDNPSFDPDDESVPEDVRAIAKNRMRLDEERARMAKDRAREQVESRFGSFTYTIRAGKTVRIVAYDGTDRHVTVPETIEGCDVAALDSDLFLGHDEIEEIIIPDTVDTLGHRLFERCTSLKRIRFPRNLKQVGAGIFTRCASIDYVQVNSPIISAESKLLAGASIEELAFGPDVQEFGCSDLGIQGLERISVDPSNETLSTDGLALFSKDGTVLMRLIVPAKRYAVPEGCQHIADHAFDSSKSLHDVTLPHGLTGIGLLAFAKTSLTSIALPQTLEAIGDKAFFSCTRLNEIIIPPSVRTIGAEAFFASGVKRATLPACLQTLGQGAFDKTPAQQTIAQGSLSVGDMDGRQMKDETLHRVRIDRFGGVYLDDTFLELIGQVSTYHIAPGTRVVAPCACKRHHALHCVSIPEGVEEIGEDAFRGCKALSVVELPGSLRCIGARAFLDTAVRHLRIGAQVSEIGNIALLVQGENGLTATAALTSIELDPANEHFYLENGLLCQRNGNKSGGDAVVLYLGPDHVVRIPEAVTQINNLAFCGADGIDELYLHDHIKSICLGALSTKRTVDKLHLTFAQEINGTRETTLLMPEYTSRYRSMMPLFGTNDKKVWFNFPYYDTWVSCATTIPEFAPAAYARLKNPVRLSKRCREMYEGTFTRKAQAVVRFFSEKGDLDALLQLHEWGFIDMRHIGRELDDSLSAGAAQKTACLLELRKRVQGERFGGIDFSL